MGTPSASRLRPGKTPELGDLLDFCPYVRERRDFSRSSTSLHRSPSSRRPIRLYSVRRKETSKRTVRTPLLMGLNYPPLITSLSNSFGRVPVGRFCRLTLDKSKLIMLMKSKCIHDVFR